MPLFETVEEFSRYHKVIEKDIDADGFLDHQMSFADRVQNLLHDLGK